MRVQRRVARDADGGLDLGEAARGRLGGVGGEQGRVLLQVGHVGLVRGRAPGAQLLLREHQLDRVEQRDHAGQPRGRQSAREADELGARHVDVDEPPRQLRVVEARGLGGDIEVEAVADEKVVERVPFLLAPAVELDDASLLDHERGLRVVRAVHRHEPELGERLDQQLAAEVALLPRQESLGAPLSRQAGPAPRTPGRPRGRTRPSAARRSLPAAPPTPPAPPRSSAAVGARCRSRGSSRPGAARARRRGGGCPRAGAVRPRAATSACSRSVSGVTRSSPDVTRSSYSASSSSGISPGVRIRSGRFAPSG